jgi:hypothetical protein
MNFRIEENNCPGYHENSRRKQGKKDTKPPPISEAKDMGREKAQSHRQSLPPTTTVALRPHRCEMCHRSDPSQHPTTATKGSGGVALTPEHLEHTLASRPHHISKPTNHT